MESEVRKRQDRAVAATHQAHALRRVFCARELSSEGGCDVVHILGSFWPYARANFESRLVKSFKECVPTRAFEPHIGELSRFYAGEMLHRTAGEKPDWVVRVLSSAETKPEADRPQQILADLLCVLTGARGLTELFFKVESRPPMRGVKRLSGRNALERRLAYVLQDLFIRPFQAGGCVLLIDDIYNTGASMKVYAEALRRFAGAQRVVGVNLAATRFAGGRDGLDRLELDVSALESHPTLRPVWLDAGGRVHASRECPAAERPLACEPRFVAERLGTACRDCLPQQPKKRHWWQIGRA